MPPAARTKVSTKGQVILPKAVRDEKNWPPGTVLSVEITAEGILLRPERRRPASRHQDVFGMVTYDGPPRTIEDFEDAIAGEVMRRHDRGRY